MRCGGCQHELPTAARTCPRCGRVARAADTPGESTPGAARVVEGSIERDIEPGEEASLSHAPASDAAATPNRALVPAASVPPARVTLSRLPALAWRQPAVRSAVKTGASAVALTVALRLAGRLIMRRGGGRVARASMLPMMTDLLRQGDAGQTVARRGRSGEVTETLIYLRRTVRW